MYIFIRVFTAMHCNNIGYWILVVTYVITSEYIALKWMCECGTLDFYNVRFKSNAFFRSLKYFYKQETLINIYFDSHTGQTEIRLQYTKKHLFFSFCLASLPVSKCNIITDSIIRHVSLSLSLCGRNPKTIYITN